MSRTVSRLALVSLGLGVFLLTLAPLLAWYVTPHAKRTPIDVDITTVSTGNGSYFDTTSLSVLHDQTLTITRRVLGNVAESKHSGHAVWDVSTTIDTPRTLPLADPRKSLQWTTERWVTDRRTNAPVHCCQEAPVPHQGDAYLKFPFDLRKRTYQWWDATLNGTVPLHYAGTGKVLGHQGYRYTGTVPPTRVGTRQVPGILVGLPRRPQVQAEEWYANPAIDLVVDRRTGRVLDAAISPVKSLRAPGGAKDAVTLLQGDRLEFDRQTQHRQVDLAAKDNRKLLLIGTVAPLAGAGTGTLLTAASAGLMVFKLRKSPRLARRGETLQSPKS
ncbi:DUF3068 domain-containing protein [Streptomyces sp. BPTC-684]|uniref:DUF3068 domain-containing protein n=1 Tax=Streptomyces sp. BPTC-684 TaxID=3043734 RepID=UPI0024B25A67|nr:DUF3068 domain-containing protein [Streptomyces sp. BPTC-684]WHM41050.1 DUF3068 domain-containing protein [Streptomyces sp. BPTC-684]